MGRNFFGAQSPDFFRVNLSIIKVQIGVLKGLMTDPGEESNVVDERRSAKERSDQAVRLRLAVSSQQEHCDRGVQPRAPAEKPGPHLTH